MSNPSREVMRRSVEGHLTDLERMREFDRGYRAGKAAMSAEYNMLRQSCKNGDNCKTEVSESVESSKCAENCKSGHSRTCPESGDKVSESAPSVSITDELRECVERATKTYDDTAWYDVDDGDEHTWCSITVAEINGIATRIEEQFSRFCEQQEAVLQSTIDEMGDEFGELMANNAELAAKYGELRDKLDELDVSGATALYKLLKATLGEAKNAADSLVAARESRAMLEDELRRKTAEVHGLRHECSTYRDMLGIASDELGSIKKHLDEIAGVLDA